MTARRPRWADTVRFWATDDQYNWMDWWGGWLERKLPSKTMDFITERIQSPWIQRPIVKALCWTYGHKAVADCSIPEHDYCVYCMESMPGQAPFDERPGIKC